MRKKNEHHDIESVLDAHSQKEKSEIAKETRRAKKSAKSSEKLSKNATEKERKEFIEDQLEEIGEAIEDDVDEKLEEAEAILETQDEEPVAVFVKDEDTAKQISSLRKAVSTGFETTQKNIVVFYEQASQAGDRVRGIIYVLLGLSVMFTGFFAKDINLVTFKDILVQLSNSFAGRIIVFTIGFSLFAYGTRKFFFI